MGAVIKMQRTPHPVHAPPVPHAVRVVALSRDRPDLVAAPVDRDGSGYRTGDFVAGGDPVGVRHPGSGPGEIHAEPNRPARLTAQRCRGIVVDLRVSGDLDPVGLQRNRGAVPQFDAVPGHHSGIVRQWGLEIQQCHRWHAGSAHQRVDPGEVLVGNKPQPDPSADPLLGVGEVPVPALVPQRLVTGRVRRLIDRIRLQRRGCRGARQHVERPGVQYVAAMAIQHGQEHLIATVGALHQHRGDDRHHHPEETLSPHPLAHLVEGQGRVRAQAVVISTQQFAVMGSAILGLQRTPQEVGHVGHGGSPGDGLPIHHGQVAQ